MSLRRAFAASASGLCLLGLVAATPARAQPSEDEHWVGTWATAVVSQPVSTDPDARTPAPPPLANRTLRQIVRVSLGGEQLRVTLSNTYGTQPLEVGGAQVSRRTTDTGIEPGSSRRLTFGGRETTTIPAGALVVSDPVALRVPALSDLAIDLHLPHDTTTSGSPLTVHSAAHQTSYVSTAGDHLGAVELPVEATFSSWFFLSRVEVVAPSTVGAVVLFGDSITDGSGSTRDTNSRWPDHLARRLHDAGIAMGVLNLGIGGNRVLSDGLGVSALARFDRDVLAQPGVTHVLVLEGINDIGLALNELGLPRSETRPTADAIIFGHEQLIARARTRGLRIYGGTFLPYEGTSLAILPSYWSADGDTTRQEINEWMRTSGAYDAVVDFEAAVQDPAAPTRILPRYDSGDGLHPSDAGYAAMAAAVDLALLHDGVATADASSPVDRTPWGDPDLAGIWNNVTATPLERPAALADQATLTDEEAAEYSQRIATRRADFEGRSREEHARQGTGTGYATSIWFETTDALSGNRTSLLVDPADGQLPALTSVAQRAADRLADSRRMSPADTWWDRGPYERCVSRALPGAMMPGFYNHNYQILQTPEYVAILVEMVHDARIVPIDGRDHVDPAIRQWLGDSRGWWEGDTLVIETTNLLHVDQRNVAVFGTSEQGRVIERFTRLDDDMMDYRITVEDPATFTADWTASIPMTRVDGPLYEYACHEGNYAMPNILAGHRLEEAAADAER